MKYSFEICLLDYSNYFNILITVKYFIAALIDLLKDICQKKKVVLLSKCPVKLIKNVFT